MILCGLPLAGYTGLVRELRSLGAERCLLIASGEGTGELPDEADADHVMVEVDGRDVIDLFRCWERRMATPDAGVSDVVERFDPDRTAVVLVTPVQAIRTVAGRPAYGARRPEWVALEDKTTVDAFWDRIGVHRAPAEIVAAERDAVVAAAGRIDRGAGTVWAGDGRDGFNGGGVFVRWIREDAADGDVDEAARFFADRCDVVRVAPFLEGIPCSIHGMVLPGHVAAFRPVEMVTLRPPAGNRLRYAGASTFWDPPAADREEMRRIARRAGEALRCDVDFRGSFTVDGVLTEDGFLPTELNPRFGAGLGVLRRAIPDLPLDLLHHAAVAGEPLDWRPEELEALVVAGADARREGGGWLTHDTPWQGTETRRLVGGADGYRFAEDGETADATLLAGPSEIGGFVRLTLDPGRNAAGPPAAPRAVAAFALADAELGTSIGPLTPARPVR